MFPPALRAALKAAALCLLTLVLLAPHLLCLAVGKGGLCARLWHRAACRILGLKVRVEGAPVSGGGAVFVGNHLSYLDIPLLGALLPGACFVAKADVRGWPVFGVLAVLNRTIFISRNPRDAMKVDVVLHAALRRGESLVIFPEGTSSAGETVLPFKSSAFSALAHPDFRAITVQPFTIDLQTVNGAPAATTQIRDQYAYYKDHVLAPHLWGFLGMCGAELRVVFHPAVGEASKTERKIMGQQAFEAVRQGLRR